LSGFEPTAHRELAENRGNVVIHCSGGDHETPSDISVAKAVGPESGTVMGTVDAGGISPSATDNG
jgi:hypothetical protein